MRELTPPSSLRHPGFLAAGVPSLLAFQPNKRLVNMNPMAKDIWKVRARPEDEDDFLDSLDYYFTKFAATVSREVKIPKKILPARPDDTQQDYSTIRSGYIFLCALSFSTGNYIFPVAFISFLFLSRPADAPDYAALIAAALTSAAVSPLLEDALNTDDLSINPVIFVLALVVSLATYIEAAKGVKMVYDKTLEGIPEEEREFYQEMKTMSYWDLRLKDLEKKRRKDKQS